MPSIPAALPPQAVAPPMSPPALLPMPSSWTPAGAGMRYRRVAAGAAIARGQPAPAAARRVPSAAARPPEKPVYALPSDWVERLDLNAFDDIAFLRACGEIIADDAFFGARLAAAHRCFSPQSLPHRGALDPDGLDPAGKRLFFSRMLSAIGCDGMAVDACDPAFLQILFRRWFLGLAAAPDSGSVSDGSPLSATLLAMSWSAAAAPPACAATAGDAMSPPDAMRLPRLRESLLSGFALPSLRPSDPAPGAAALEWIFNGLMEVFAPTLIRPDAPDNLRYGSLEWTLLAIGTRLTGTDHWRYTHEELVGLALAADPCMPRPSGSDADTSVAADDDASLLDGLAADAVLQFAHTAGAIDLRKAFASSSASAQERGTQQEQTSERDGHADMDIMLNEAARLFHAALAERRRDTTANALFAALPTRRQIAAVMLRERGLQPERGFHLQARRDLGVDLLAAQTRLAPCLALGRRHTLAEAFMADCLPQLGSDAALSGAEATALGVAVAGLTHAGLETRFDREFDAAFRALSDGPLTAALQDAINRLDAGDIRFWQCGKATVLIPTASFKVRQTPRANLGASGAGRPRVVANLDLEMEDSILVSLHMGSEQGQQARHYWVTAQPFDVARFDGDVAGLLWRKHAVFYKPDTRWQSLLGLNREVALRYRVAAASPPAGRVRTAESTAAASGMRSSAQSVAQFAMWQLLAPILPEARRLAYETTEAEADRQHLDAMLLDLLPLHACYRAVRDGRPYAATFLCGADAMTLVPVLGAGVRVASAATRSGISMSTPQGRRLLLLLSGLNRARVPPEAAAAVLRVGVPLIELSRQSAQWLNPARGWAGGLSWLGGRLGKTGLSIVRRMQDLPALAHLSGEMARSIGRGRKFYRRHGLWHARDTAVDHVGGRRQLRLAGRVYPLYDLGPLKNVVTTMHGANLYLLNPESGMPYGPALNRPPLPLPPLPPLPPPAVPIKLSGWPDRPDRPRAHRAPHERSCRPRRANSDAVRRARGGACAGIVPARRFGTGFRRFAQVESLQGFQAGRGSHAAEDLLPLDLSDMAFASYSLRDLRADGDMRPYDARLYDTPYLAFDQTVWTLHENGILHRTGIACPFPKRIAATVSYHRNNWLDAPGQGDAVDLRGYLEFEIELPRVEGDPRRYFNRFIAPYAVYPGHGGACMGMLEMTGIAYRFMLESWHIAPRSGTTVLLVAALPSEQAAFVHYQQLNALIEKGIGTFDTLTLRRLRTLDYATQHRFDVVLARAGKIIADADRALRSRDALTEQLLHRFVPALWPLWRKRKFVAQIGEKIGQLQLAMPILRRDRLDVIAIGDAYRKINGGPDGHAAPAGFVRAEAIAGSLGLDIDFTRINKALIHFDRVHFEGAPIDALAADLIHELSHARFSSRDTIHAEATQNIYPYHSTLEGGLIDLAPLWEAATQIGSDGANHASTLEYLIVVLAYSRSPSNRRLLDRLLAGGSTLSLAPDKAAPGCMDECVLLR